MASGKSRTSLCLFPHLTNGLPVGPDDPTGLLVEQKTQSDTVSECATSHVQGTVTSIIPEGCDSVGWISCAITSNNGRAFPFMEV